jgi:hypothetical protein
MRSDDLERAKQDLATMKLALAPGLPFHPQTIRFALAIGLGGALTLLGALQPYQLPQPWSTVAPLALGLLPLIATMAHFILTYRPGSIEVSSTDMRRAHMHYAPYVVALLAIPFLIVAHRSGWVPQSFLSPAFLFIFGASITAVAVTEPRQRYLLAFSLPMLAGAIAALIFNLPLLVTYGFTFLTGGTISALCMKMLLRRQETARAAH